MGGWVLRTKALPLNEPGIYSSRVTFQCKKGKPFLGYVMCGTDAHVLFNLIQRLFSFFSVLSFLLTAAAVLTSCHRVMAEPRVHTQMLCVLCYHPFVLERPFLCLSEQGCLTCKMNIVLISSSECNVQTILLLIGPEFPRALIAPDFLLCSMTGLLWMPV